MNALLWIETNDDAIQVLKSGDHNWKSALNGKESWQQPNFDDSTWKAPVQHVSPPSPFETGKLGHPWPTGALKALRNSIVIEKTLASARLTAKPRVAHRL